MCPRVELVVVTFVPLQVLNNYGCSTALNHTLKVECKIMWRPADLKAKALSHSAEPSGPTRDYVTMDVNVSRDVVTFGPTLRNRRRCQSVPEE